MMSLPPASPDSLEHEKIQKSGKLSIKDGFFAGIMNGCGDQYISAYALLLGASHFFIALITTAPSLLGNFSQLFSLRLLKRHARKYIVVGSSFLQALLWLPLIGIGFLYLRSTFVQSFSPFLILLCYGALVIIGSFAAPLWHSWMRDLVSVNKGQYFGLRNQIANIAIIISMLVSGIILHYFTAGDALFGFMILFLIACVARLVSVYFLSHQYEPAFVYVESSYFSLREFVSRILANNFGRFVLFVSLLSLGTSIAGPFFVVYELETLGLDYLSFTLINLSMIVATIVFLPFWGRFSDRFGNVRVLRMTGLLIPFLPLLWIGTLFIAEQLTLVVLYLVFVQMFSGFLWGGFNLAASNFIFDAVTKERMPLCVAYFNVINAVFAFVGSMLGSMLIALDAHFLFLNGFLFVFFMSFIVRLVVVALFYRNIKEVRSVPDVHLKKRLKEQFYKTRVIIWRYIGFRPIRLAQ